MITTMGLVRIALLILVAVDVSRQQEEDIPHNEVKNWALKFGVDLWAFGKQITKMSDIHRGYHNIHLAGVTRKDGLVLVREMAQEVKNMMDFKMNAVMKLMESAEHAALSGQRDSNSSPRYYASHRLNLFSENGKVAPGAREMHLVPNRHFDHLAVNVNLSAVLLPPDILDTEGEVSSGLQWSEHLDLLFVNNYESDPSLSWQYYGATSGFLRRFPAISWPPIDTTNTPRVSNRVRDVYDFRISDWFIGGATSPKDLVILVDSSSLSSSKVRGMMIATVKTILDTLRPDDYVNVFSYAENTQEIVPCFKDILVSATPDNVRELKTAMNVLSSKSPVNVSAAMSTAFEILQKYNRTGLGSQCNQAIMLITSDSTAPSVELVKKYNSPHMPVRIFTYLVGGSDSPDLQSMSCSNKGFYARITNRAEINVKVFEYIKVMARPMVLYHDHPKHWTSVYVGGKSSRYGFEGQGQLMTSVTAPILDRRNHTVKSANLLGIVGTDVPIDQVKKLVPPYKLGVNGYSFIVNNNGHVLYHPDLRPLPGNIDYEETLKPKYINVDLSEVELSEFDDPSYPSNNSHLLDLRHDMIDQKEGETEFAVKIHYDDMRRVSIRRHKYVYNPIDGTPFSLGLAIPEGYGMYELHAEQEIRHSDVNVTEYFKGDFWKVHPDWVYCEYSSASEKRFATPEERVLHFLSQTRNPGWKWKSIRPRSHQKQASKPDKEAHYCDKSLVQSLVLDAKLTVEFDKRSESAMVKEENPIAILLAVLHSQGKGRFGVARSFIATRSGLFRWHDHQTNEEILEEPDFGDVNRRAVDSSWYKRAVDQHAVEPESFVFSVPFDAADRTKSLVTATHAVFVELKGHKAPAAVVGLQFHHASLASHFANITSTCTAQTGCKKTCASGDLDCYILDNNGFIILSESHEHTGKFFGEIDGTIMDSLVQDKIFRKVTVMDYQGACPPQTSHTSAAMNSYSFLETFAKIGNVLWSLAYNVNLFDIWQTVWAYADENDDPVIYSDGDMYPATDDSAPDNMGTQGTLPPVVSLPSASTPTIANIHPSKLRPCVKKTDLYILQPERLNTSGQSNPLKGKLTNCHLSGCERPFSVQKIRHTNLILLVVDTLCPCGSKKLSIKPSEAVFPGNCSNRSERLYRRRPSKCTNYHPEEIDIKICSNASILHLPLALLSILLLATCLT